MRPPTMVNTGFKSVIFSMGYGRASATVGNIFPWVFTAPATYWGGASAGIHGLLPWRFLLRGSRIRLGGRRIMLRGRIDWDHVTGLRVEALVYRGVHVLIARLRSAGQAVQQQGPEQGGSLGS